MTGKAMVKNFVSYSKFLDVERQKKKLIQQKPQNSEDGYCIIIYVSNKCKVLSTKKVAVIPIYSNSVNSTIICSIILE